MSTRIDPAAANRGPGGNSSAEAYQEPPPQQLGQQYYNQYYDHHGQNQPHHANGSPYQNYDHRQMNYNNYHHQQQQQYQHQWCPPRPYYSSQEYPAPFPQHSPHQQQQFYQQPERPPWPPVERPPQAPPLDSLQMLVKENGGVNGDKRPRPSDEAAEGEGRKRRRKSDRPTRISNGSAQAAESSAASAAPEELKPCEREEVPVEEEEPPPPIIVANGGGDEAAEASDRSTPRLEIRTDESNEAPPSQGEPSESQQTPTKPAEESPHDKSEAASTEATPAQSPKKKGRPKGSKNKNPSVRRKVKQPEMVLEDDDDEKKKKKKKSGKKKKIVATAAVKTTVEPVEEKEKQLIKGPVIRISGNRETVVNSGKSEEELGKKPRSCINDAELRTKVAGMGFTSAMAQHYDAFTLDETWICAFCKQGSHQNALGDLFGPYFVQTAKKKKKFEVWVHESCCVWAPGVGLVGQRLVGLQEAIFSSADKECEVCKKKGAMIGCVKRGCERKIHYPCSDDWHLDSENFISCCPDHERIRRDPELLRQK
ncbi:uncharacterized protein CG5098 [Neocloeon triangulifer]|uniref:uncharacterized protein CG5098 n=1 Tax=Neocloeon triangulifer TaxID=2078957 RepID=UPI00286EFA14|nr:uncharacterized protein CG5098 [Neocloeon triangulifer]